MYFSGTFENFLIFMIYFKFIVYSFLLCFVNNCLSFRPVSFDNWMVCLCTIYGF
jgi:hypothetical protein